MKNGLILDQYGNGTKHWYKNDELHREDGPAIIWEDGTKLWCQNGQRHRTDGPAIEHYSGDKHWFYEGEQAIKLNYKIL